MTSIALAAAPGRSLWRGAQTVGLILTLALIGALWVVPKVTLHLLWDMVIPLLPAVFLVNPMLWRNVCPLATVNDLTWVRRDRGALGHLRPAWSIGIVLLLVLVPARRFLFNENGPALAITVTLVAALALVAGLRFARRSGFCNSICPVLSVEKLYGQSPLLDVRTARCADCTLCTPVGCIDLASTKTIAQTIGPLRRDTGWLRTSFGAFVAAFPGFIIAYFTTENGGLSTAAAVYSRVLLWCAASYSMVAVLTIVFRARAAIVMPLLGAVAVGLYYWYAAPTIAEAFWAPSAGATVVRGLALLLVGVWLARNVMRRRPRVVGAAAGSLTG